ncbi:mitochondrial ATP synthase epsilon chain-domain-containing protein [Dioszegia hungarica]|uniref:Mitochondrial ATP synthase epsilon chain-domain-containing protein n=1 Tax=Dioszegia hungarica TaxID=4972 RepID=A0AA38LU61_9TREE|nr:mitochondrial ATP synthase epsilon chain-domain-containing protein [Dioszegia hungarica]KAI9635385.1 mitochondrial ATP synthase epsilon chain-domain-containing protein [Dioszegia hungarica]
MSAATWREFMTWNKYTQIASRAVRQALTETERVGAERRAQIGVRYQLWENGQGGESKFVIPQVEKSGKPKDT